MARDRYHLDAAALERLLDRTRGGPAFDAGPTHGAVPAHLERLISAAAAATFAGDQAAEDAAVAAFVAARGAGHAGVGLGPRGLGPRAVARHRPNRSRWSRLVTVKALAVGLALGTGGVALAAGTGVLPNPLRSDPPAIAPVRPPRSDLASSGAQPAVPSPPASPSASLDGLCQAYLRQLAADHDATQRSPAFAGLFATAGGVDKTVAYCEARLATPPGAGKEHPTGPPSPPTRPTVAAPQRPALGASERPARIATEEATGLTAFAQRGSTQS